MHTKETIDKAKYLLDSGLNLSQVSREIGVNRSTIREWFSEAKRYTSTTNKPRQNNFIELFEGSPEIRKAYYYLLGQYLGDGSISVNSRAYRLRISATTKYVNIINEIVESMKIIFPHNSVYYCEKMGCTDVTINSKHIPEIFPHHGIGKKHERTIKLSEWQLKYLDENNKWLARGLFHSDGCRYINPNGQNYYYTFTNCSMDIHKIYQRCLTGNSIEFTFNKKTVYGNNAKAWNTIMYRKAEVDKAYEFLGEKS